MNKYALNLFTLCLIISLNNESKMRRENMSKYITDEWEDKKWRGYG